ncbi:hypothetical protein, partial [Segeticoccus rhizosphaerae]|uniref:hypothetical protein n=1 Tax=Segeticoccus rhizosphaerae TaxID=1104777 RepID=UPI0019399DDC
MLTTAGFSMPLNAQTTGTARALPQGLFRLTRLLERELVDGAVLSVERSWSCKFEHAGRGMRVVGEALDCFVKAPESLAPLAALEKQRKDMGPFPALLHSSGLIASPVHQEPVDHRQVVDVA